MMKFMEASGDPFIDDGFRRNFEIPSRESRPSMPQAGRWRLFRYPVLALDELFFYTKRYHAGICLHLVMKHAVSVNS